MLAGTVSTAVTRIIDVLSWNCTPVPRFLTFLENFDVFARDAHAPELCFPVESFSVAESRLPANNCEKNRASRHVGKQGRDLGQFPGEGSGFRSVACVSFRAFRVRLW